MMTRKISERADEENDEEPDEGHSALQGKYSIGEELGYGGYATVRLGTNLTTGEQVAVKIITRKGLRYYRLHDGSAISLLFRLES